MKESLNTKKIIIELYARDEEDLNSDLAELSSSGLVNLDRDFKPIKITKRRSDKRFLENPDTFVVRGSAAEENIPAISRLPFVVNVWSDTVIEPFKCGCNPSRKGDLGDVATCIGAKQLWQKGFDGDGVTIGIVDGGIDKTVVPHVVNGSSPGWGTIPAGGDTHGNMTATDALGIAPSASLYDLNYSINLGGTISGVLSQALQAFDWAIQQHAIDGTPHILSNSWGIYQENWDYGYATNPNHPFTLKVEEALDKGIRILFAAGNCGRPCKLCKCGADTGGSKDIWGAQGHEEVMTVGAVKLNNKRLRYSSQGPAALSDKKPNFCGYSSFKGYYAKDSGTSAACPVVAGAIALLLNYNNSLTQSQIKDLLERTAKDIEAFGFDYNTGYGVVRIDNAFYDLEPAQKPKQDFRDRLCDYVYTVERRCTKWADEGSYACSQWADQGSSQCSQWADQGSNQCSKWADQGKDECQNWADQGHNQCASSYWNECHWYSPWNCIAGLICDGYYWVANWVCQAWYWVANWVCQAWHWVANWVCQAWYWVAKWVCLAWYWVAKWVCRAYVWVIAVVTLTNCTCR
jgi:hypothetical protein